MNNSKIEHLSIDLLPLAEQFLAKQTFHSSDWDRRLSAHQKAALARIEIEQTLKTGEGFIAIKSGESTGLCAIGPLPWESEYFETPMGAIKIFRASDMDSSSFLADSVTTAARRSGFRHAHFMVDSRDRNSLISLQDNGWRVVWASMRMSCETATVDTSSFTTRMNDFGVVPYEASHLGALLEISSRLEDYSMLAFEESLHPDRRRDYKVVLTRNCCETDFADASYTLLHRGEPAGFNSSKILIRPIDGARYTVERVTFIDPELQGSGCSKFFERAVMKYLKPHAEFVTGRVRLNATGMFRMLESAGIKPVYGELCLALEL